MITIVVETMYHEANIAKFFPSISESNSKYV